MKKIATLICSVLAISCAAQSIDKYPFFANSITLEFSAPLSYLSSIAHGNYSNTNSIRLPGTFLSAELRIKKKFYAEFGFAPASDPFTMYFNSRSGFRNKELTCYAGGLLKLKLFRNFYFTPSVDFHYSRARRFYSNMLSENSSYYTLGPTVGFEYFFSKRISLNTDLLNLNLGLHYDTEGQTLGAQSYFTVYKILSLGLHYNFDWKKKSE